MGDSRKLDEMVAEKVFGWTRSLKKCPHLHPAGIPEPNEYHSCAVILPSYSTDIREAWTIVEHFMKTPKLALFFGFLESRGLYCGATEAARNICLAALDSVKE